MNDNSSNRPVGLLYSGGLDSGILLGLLLSQGREVQPIYINSQLYWQPWELLGAERFLRAVATDRLQELVKLEMPLRDLYGDHWSVTGENVPDADSADDAVYLPGRNALLAIKAALWCQMHDIEQLALGVLRSNPFSDATPDFCRAFAALLKQCVGREIEIVLPLAEMTKRDVMSIAHGLPLEHTFSCISPIDGLHCGACNKCAERQNAFRLVDRPDPTPYRGARQ
jgi:7-cyano-7-deazaguanine synthase